MKKFLFAAPIALAAALISATPASAAVWNSGQQVNAQISQLDRQISNAQRSRDLNQRDAQQLSRQVDQLQNLSRQYARGGFSRTELRTLSSRIESVQAQLAAKTRDSRHDDNRGKSGRDNDRHDSRDNNRGNNWGGRR